jgi:hypothetical protein
MRMKKLLGEALRQSMSAVWQEGTELDKHPGLLRRGQPSLSHCHALENRDPSFLAFPYLALDED